MIFRKVFSFFFSLGIILAGYSLETKAQTTDTIVYQTSKAVVYGPKFKYGEERLKQEFINSLNHERYDLVWFDWRSDDSLAIGRIRIPISLKITKQGELEEVFVIDDERNANSLSHAISRVSERIKYSWIPAYAIFKEDGRKEDVSWDIIISLYFKDGRLEIVRINPPVKETEP